MMIDQIKSRTYLVVAGCFQHIVKTHLGQNNVWRRTGCNGGKATIAEANCDSQCEQIFEANCEQIFDGNCGEIFESKWEQIRDANMKMTNI